MKGHTLDSETRYDGIVDHKSLDQTLDVDVFSSIQQAIDHLGSNSVILVKKGRYDEKIMVDYPDVTIIGEDRDQTVITHNTASGTMKADGTKYGTFDSASVIINKQGFTAINLTFQNHFDYLQEYQKSDDHPTKIDGLQAVSFRTAGESNQTVLKNCRFSSYQDTLLLDKGTHFLDRCVIEGAVDFIFGAGQAFFDHCDIISLDRFEQNTNGFVTAASTSVYTAYGFLFYRCHIKKQSNKMGDRTVYLGRPWHPGGDPEAQASVLFYECFLDHHIKDEGWTVMKGFSPMTARLFEYKNKGPGTADHVNRRELTQAEAECVYNVLEEKCKP
ncbi:pectinesterase [Gracilibacillus halophilus YIM-C55.5]|uniref:Pectinesterase n=1 Tax=Gracilibacillus halophilus YIM-C55.5 TaxID=1308866 RepID=N4WRT1_9BACI|nr:pectinesterase family protein [Gracilibacillus halophilus]ENH97085.1 pectinesterase [Gracilibacillus halophilus YIM-C55.5]